MKMDSINEEVDYGTRRRILDAAVVLFAEKGYASTSVREIVDRAGVTKPVLYYHFGNKEGLLQAIIDRTTLLQGELLEEITRLDVSAMEKIKMLAKRVADAANKQRELVKMFCSLNIGSPQGAPDLSTKRHWKQFSDAIKRIYDDGVRNGELLNVDVETVIFLFGGLFDSVTMYAYSGILDDPSRRLDEMIELAFLGLKPR